MRSRARNSRPVSIEGGGADLALDADRRLRLCPAGVLGNEFLGRAKTEKQRELRERMLIAVGAKTWWAMPDADIANALGLRAASVRGLIKKGIAAIRREAERLQIEPEMIFPTKREQQPEVDEGTGAED